MKTSDKGILVAASGLMALLLGVGVTRLAACLQGLADGLVQHFLARAAF